MDILKAKGGSYIYEVRRNIDVWDFAQVAICLLTPCFYLFATNLPELWGHISLG